MTQESFSVWLDERIKDEGMSRAEFIERSRISKPMVYLMLKGKRLPTPTSAAKVADALHADLEEVLGFARKGPGRPANSPNKA